MSAFRIEAAAAWKRLYRRDPPWRSAHFAALDDAERICGSAVSALDAWNVYLTIFDDKKYFMGHSPMLFAKHIEQFAIPAESKNGFHPDQPPCAVCLDQGWAPVTNVKTPKGNLVAEAAAPCGYCRLGKIIAAAIRKEIA